MAARERRHSASDARLRSPPERPRTSGLPTAVLIAWLRPNASTTPRMRRSAHWERVEPSWRCSGVFASAAGRRVDSSERVAKWTSRSSM